jgi:hypothetical protein
MRPTNIQNSIKVCFWLKNECVPPPPTLRIHWDNKPYYFWVFLNTYYMYQQNNLRETEIDFYLIRNMFTASK